MKTAIEQLIEELNGNSFQELFSNQNYIKEYLESRLKSIYLEAEKEQIWMAFNDGKVSAIVKNQRTPEEYYNLTFKSDE